MDLGLTGKNALVTGGSKGIGKSIAIALAREGANVAIVARTSGPLEETAREIEKETGRTIVPLVADKTINSVNPIMKIFAAIKYLIFGTSLDEI